MRSLPAERRVGERQRRLVQALNLVRDPGQGLVALEAAVQRGQLGRDAVEAFEQRVELPVCHALALHGPIVPRDSVGALKTEASGEGTRCESGTVPPL